MCHFRYNPYSLEAYNHQPNEYQQNVDLTKKKKSKKKKKKRDKIIIIYQFIKKKNKNQK
jgi:hypothetical protein